MVKFLGKGEQTVSWHACGYIWPCWPGTSWSRRVREAMFREFISWCQKWDQRNSR